MQGESKVSGQAFISETNAVMTYLNTLAGGGGPFTQCLKHDQHLKSHYIRSKVHFCNRLISHIKENHNCPGC